MKISQKIKKLFLSLLALSLLVLIAVFIYSLIYLDGSLLKLVSLIAIIFFSYYFVRGILYIARQR